MRVRIEHTTTFTYDYPADGSFNEVRLTPRNDERQNVLDFALETNPRSRLTSFRDHFGTIVHSFNVSSPHDQLTIVSGSTVVTSPRRRPPDATGALEVLEDSLFRDTEAEWLHSSPLASGGDHLYSFAEHVRRTVRPSSVAELVMGVCHEVHHRFKYLSGSSYVSSTVDDLLERGTGVCQDFAHLTTSALRQLGVPARYVSGYFYAGPPGEPEHDVPLAVESHAWVEALVPGWGWVELDPTNDCLADERHVVVAVGRDYGDVAPVRGVVRGGGGSRLQVNVTMTAPSALTPPRRRPVVAGAAAEAVSAARAERTTRPEGRALVLHGPPAGAFAQQQQQQQQ
jgi:transglutaminase-like putative cysteine protease